MYPTSVGPAKTECLPARTKSPPPHDTVTEPDSGTTTISSWPDRRSIDSPAASSATHRLVSAHPAVSGVTATVTGGAPVDPAGRYSALFISAPGKPRRTCVQASTDS